MPSRSDFLGDYEFSIEPLSDFQNHGQAPTWASGHPKEWGQENESIEIPTDGTNQTYNSISSAISPNAKLLAVSNNAHILIYDIDSKELRQKLDGTGKIFFAPSPPSQNDDSGVGDANAVETPAYTLVSSVSDIGDPNRDSSKLVLFELDKHGRLLDEEEPIDASAFATKAIESISKKLEQEHEWSKDFVAASTLHSDFERALKRAAANHRRRNNTAIDIANLPSYGESPFSSDGKFMLYVEDNHTDQRSPSVVVWDVKSSKEVLRLNGHTDAVMFASFSPDDQNIATVSWDGTMRLHSATTGALTWVTENSKGQAWTGAFTPDSHHIVWSSKGGSVIQVYNVADGRLVSTLPKTFHNWCRSLTWHPDSQQLAMCAGAQVYVWRPFDGIDGAITQSFSLPKDDWHGFGQIEILKWLERGQKLALISPEGTALVWDAKTQSKELFRRKKGTQVAWTDDGFYHIADEGKNKGNFYLSIDGDGKVRYWRTSVPVEPSWWDKMAEPVPRKEYPETGKYVNITKQKKSNEGTQETVKEDKVVNSEKVKEESARDAWVEKGAEIWTAE